MGKYQAEEATYRTGPPLVVDFMEEEIHKAKRHFEQKRRAWPSEIPSSFNQAAQWWIGMQKPPKQGQDNCYEVSVVGRGETRWECPYHLRIAANFRIYIALTDVQRETIRAALEDGVWWNGDEHKIFIMIYDETLKMRKDPETYKANTRKMVRRFIGNG